jgi:hypothetical protein
VAIARAFEFSPAGPCAAALALLALVWGAPSCSHRPPVHSTSDAGRDGGQASDAPPDTDDGAGGVRAGLDAGSAGGENGDGGESGNGGTGAGGSGGGEGTGGAGEGIGGSAGSGTGAGGAREGTGGSGLGGGSGGGGPTGTGGRGSGGSGAGGSDGGGNMIVNGDFSDGESSWQLIMYGAATVTHGVQNGVFCMNMQAGASVTLGWPAAPAQAISLVKGTRYHFAFGASASAPRTSFFFEAKVGSGRSFDIVDDYVEPTFQPFQQTFTASEDEAATGIAFNISTGVTMDVCLDSIDLRTVAAGADPAVNLIDNGDFQRGERSWHVVAQGGTVVTHQVKNGALCVTLASLASATIGWPVDGASGFALVMGTSYELTYQASTSVVTPAPTFEAKVGYGTDLDVTSDALSSTLQTFRHRFVAGASNASTGMAFNILSNVPDGSTEICVDNVALTTAP